MEYILSAIFLLILIGSYFGKLPRLFSLVFVFQLFSSMALLPPDLVGGSSFTPGSFAAFFFVVKALSSAQIRNESVHCAFNFKQLGFLTLFLFVAVVGAFVLPRMFEGSVHVYTMRTAHFEFVAPSTSNYTQAAYLILSTLVATSVCTLAQKDGFLDIFLRVILAGAYTVIGTGLLDMVANMAGLSWVLDYFRTANYVFMTDNMIEGTRRIIGLTPEASAYGAIAAGYCAIMLYVRPAFPPHLMRKATLAGWGCGTMAILSTSSTAYGMMALVLGLYALCSIDRITPEGTMINKTLGKKILPLLAALVLVGLIMVFDQDILLRFTKLVDTLIFKKASSSSYEDRSRMTAVGLQAFFDSYGFGVGAGTARTSNFFVNVMASTGVLGSLLFLLFLGVTFTRRALREKPYNYVMLRGSQLALIPIFAGMALSGTTPDFGPVVGVLFGVIAGLAQGKPKDAWVSPLARKNDAPP
jgi:hypothetical protein